MNIPQFSAVTVQHVALCLIGGLAIFAAFEAIKARSDLAKLISTNALAKASA